MNVLELFSGSGKMSSSFKMRGHKVVSIDIRKRKNTCEPDIWGDIGEISRSFIASHFNGPINFIWCGLPCDIWSYASGGFHLDKEFNPKTEKAKKHLDLLGKCQALISELNPNFFAIENPRGKLRHYTPFIEWLKSKQGFTYCLTMSSYGFPTTKPTNIFTNCPDLKFKELDAFGRGAKCNQVFANLTKVQRQSYPINFCNDVVKLVESKF